MENINFGAVETIWGAIPMTIYMIYGFIRDYAKSKKEKKGISIEDILKRLDEHEVKDKETYKMIFKDLHAQKVLISILLTPHNCSQSRFIELRNEYNTAKEKGVNGIVSMAFIEFCEKRDKKVKSNDQQERN